ncbi:MAG: hypothetical protein BMS9Abin06_0034 [Gammaproteobacteria bacterium]|nr:MAG: hypothetical protein BMS9Abin06_0034 [Gammaproteobacteria bacterium]
MNLTTYTLRRLVAAFLMSMVIALGLAACGGGSNSSNSGGSSGSMSGSAS